MDLACPAAVVEIASHFEPTGDKHREVFTRGHPCKGASGLPRPGDQARPLPARFKHLRLQFGLDRFHIAFRYIHLAHDFHHGSAVLEHGRNSAVFGHR